MNYDKECKIKQEIENILNRASVSSDNIIDIICDFNKMINNQKNIRKFDKFYFKGYFDVKIEIFKNKFGDNNGFYKIGGKKFKV